MICPPSIGGGDKMRRSAITSIIYALAAVACSMFMLSRNASGAWWEFLIIWLCVAALPLLFVYAYPRFLFGDSRPPNHLKFAAAYHGLAAVTATVLFVIFSPFCSDLPRDLGDSIFVLIVPLSVLLVFLVSAVALLVTKKSRLAVIAWISLWPYWVVLSLFFEGEWFRDTGLLAVYYFLCFLAPLLFAFASGAVSFRPKIAHAVALLGIVAAPSLYNSLKDNGMGNVWLVFNQPNDRFSYYPPWIVPGICSVAFVALAAATAVLRLLPARMQFWKSPVSSRTWPAGVFSLGVLVVWFSQSVMPYRIPGALDYSSWPILQILHIEKRGLQFHETRVSISGRSWRGNYDPREVVFSGNDRRLLRYRFAERYAYGQLSGPLVERIRAALQASKEVKADADIVKPIREWNADRWYVNPQGGSLKIYGAANGSLPPKEIVDLFNDLERLPQSNQSQSERRDVCLGFCYDPLSEMGYLFANHRCFNNGQGVVCR
jgi:hypothetical protein